MLVHRSMNAAEELAHASFEDHRQPGSTVSTTSACKLWQHRGDSATRRLRSATLLIAREVYLLCSLLTSTLGTAADRTKRLAEPECLLMYRVAGRVIGHGVGEYEAHVRHKLPRVT